MSVKRLLLLVLLVISILPLSVSGSFTPSLSSHSPDIIDTLGSALEKMIEFANLDIFSGDEGERLGGLLRILIGIMVFSIVYWAFGALNNVAGGGDIPQGIAITISICLSIITVIFLPNESLFLIGESAATFFVVIFFGLLLVGIFALWQSIPTESGPMKYFLIIFVLILTGVCFWYIRKAALSLIGGGS